MSETERKTEENESSSDEEPPPGELDKPIVILYNKRAKKEIKRFEASETKDQKSKPEKKETIVNIPNGKGQSLETMSEVVKNFASESDKDLKVIFEVLFGHKRVKLNDVRKHLRKWNGWDVDPDSQEHHELQEGIGSMTTENIKWAMDTLDISRRGLPKKEDLVDKFCDWCMKPEPFGKDSSKSSKKTPTKKSPTKVASTSKDEKPKKERKRKPEKDPNKPKKPQTAFLLFLNKNRVSFNEEAGTKNPGEIGKLASEKWKALSDADKEPFIKEAETAKAAYDIEMKEYNKNKTESPPKKPKKEESEKKSENKKTEKSSSPKAKVEKKPSAEKSKTEKSDSKKEKNVSKNDSKKVADSDKPMLALEKGKLVSKGSKKSSKPSENGTSSKKAEKKTEKKVEKSKTDKSKSNEKSGSPKKPKNTIIIPNEKQIEKFLVKLIKQSNLEQLTMKQVLAKVAEKYPDMNVSSKKSFIKTKVKELIQ